VGEGADAYAQGICNAPGTAKALAELILDGRIACADLAKLDPARYI
jgi:glycine/D-amino acid oxidase-like deaminating enzyme